MKIRVHVFCRPKNVFCDIQFTLSFTIPFHPIHQHTHSQWFCSRHVSKYRAPALAASCPCFRLCYLLKQQNSLSSSQIAAFFLSPFKNLLEPYVNWLVRFVTSSATKRRLVQALVACIVIGLLVGLALFAYLVFYWVYIPQSGHVGQIHFQHGMPT